MPDPGFAPTRVRSRGAGWYRGDCHIHSVYSDGELTPEQLATDALRAGLDFIATTEHNSANAHAAWRCHAADDLLVLLGEEVTTETGHWLALGIGPGQVIEWDYRAEDGRVGRCLEQVRESGGLCVVAHPHAPYPSGSFMYPYQGLDVVEVWNGLWTSDRPWNAENEAALAEWGRGLAEGLHAGRSDRHPAHRRVRRGPERAGNPCWNPYGPQLDRRIGCHRSVAHGRRRWPYRRDR